MRKAITITIAPPTPNEIRREGQKCKTLSVRLPIDYYVLDVQAEAGGGAIKLMLEVPEEYLEDPSQWAITEIVLKQNGDFIEEGLEYWGALQIASAAYTWFVYAKIEE